MGGLTQKVDEVLAEFAIRQHGIVTRAQLLAAGVSARVIDLRVASSMLIPIHPGVYLVGLGPEPPLARHAAAVLACRPSALLSHRTAARLWNLPVIPGGPLEVTVVGRSRRSLGGVRVYSLADLPRRELRRHEGLPLTSPSLTLLDLAGYAGREELSEALNEARILRIVTDAQLHASLQSHPNRRGARALRRHLARERGPTLTRSKAERLALNLMRRHGLEPDASDVRIGPYRVDFLFSRERLVVEVDGYRYHSDPERFVSDRRRIAALGALGYQVFPLTWHDVTAGQELATKRLAETLAERRRLLGGSDLLR